MLPLSKTKKMLFTKTLKNKNLVSFPNKSIEIPLNASSFFFFSLLSGQAFIFIRFQELNNENKLIALKNSENFNSLNQQVRELKKLVTELVQSKNSNSLDLKNKEIVLDIVTNSSSENTISFFDIVNSPLFILSM
jgi:hypothetical protein